MKNILAVASLPLGFALFAGIGSLSLIAPVQAAILTQEFEVVIDRLTRPPGETVLPPSAPPIGTRGFGRLTFDTNLIQFGVSNPFYNSMSRPIYFTRQPTSLLIDFFGNRYTNLPVFRGSAPRDTPIFVFSRTETGGYQLGSFDFGTGNESAFIAISGVSSSDSGQFSYYGGSGIADGRVSFTRSSEVIPEPTTIAGVPVAIALFWKFNRRFKRRSRNR